MNIKSTGYTTYAGAFASTLIGIGVIIMHFVSPDSDLHITLGEAFMMVFSGVCFIGGRAKLSQIEPRSKIRKGKNGDSGIKK